MSLIDGKGLKTLTKLIKNHIGIPETLSSERLDIEIISTTDNLDNYTEIGNYYCQSDSVAMTVAHCPTTIAFILKVYSGNGRSAEIEGDTFLTQYVENKNGSMWKRYKTTVDWSDWKRVSVASSESGNVGDNTNPIYIDEYNTVASDSTVGSGAQLVYMSNGVFIASSETIGAASRYPVYLNAGVITRCSYNAGNCRCDCQCDCQCTDNDNGY